MRPSPGALGRDRRTSRLHQSQGGVGSRQRDAFGYLCHFSDGDRGQIPVGFQPRGLILSVFDAGISSGEIPELRVSPSSYLPLDCLSAASTAGAWTTARGSSRSAPLGNLKGQLLLDLLGATKRTGFYQAFRMLRHCSPYLELVVAVLAGVIICPNHASPPFGMLAESSHAASVCGAGQRRLSHASFTDKEDKPRGAANPISCLGYEQHPDFDAVPPAPKIGRVSPCRRTFR